MAAADVCPPPMSTTPPPVPPPIEDLSKARIRIPTCLEELEKEWFEVDLKTAISADINEIDWNKAIGFTVSSEGSEGVIFVQFEDKSVVTIKGSSTEAADMFAMKIATLADIAIPDFRILSLGVDDEYKLLHDKLNELDENNNPLQRGKHSKAMEKPVISVIEFIKGKNLYELDPHDIFGKDSINARGANFCKALARITAYDVVINNWDRIPIIWDNKGNPENVLFTTSRKRKEISPFAIDNTVTCIDPSLEENFSEYMDKVRYLINEICQAWKEEPIFTNVRETFTITCFTKQPSVTNLRKFLGDVFLGNYDVGVAGMRYFTIGFVEKILEFAKVTKEDLEEVMEDIKKQVEKPLELANMMPESIAMQKINLDFVNSILEIFREATPVLNKIHSQMEAIGNPTN